MSLEGLWAWSLVALSLWALFLRWRVSGWAWGKGLMAPFALSAALGAGALASQGGAGPGAWALQLGGWVLFALALALPLRLARLWLMALVGLELGQARGFAERLGLFWWGPAGAWAREATEAVARVVEAGPGSPPEEALHPSRVPPSWRPAATLLWQQSMAWRQAWHEELGRPMPPPPWALPELAHRVRAHLSLDEALEAEATLACADLEHHPGRPEQVVGLATMAFALLGDRPALEAWMGPQAQGWGARLWRLIAQARSGELAEAAEGMQALRAEGESQGEWTPERAARWGVALGELRPAPPEALALRPLWRRRFQAWLAQSQLGHPPAWSWASLGLVLLLLLPQLLQSAWARDTDWGLRWSHELWRQGPLLPQAVWAGEWQRVPFSWALHADWGHFGSNALALVVLWGHAAAWLGVWGALGALLIGGLAGSGAHLLLGPDQAVVGASGNVLGLVGAALGAAWVAGKGAPWWARRRLWSVLLPVALLQLALDPILPQVAAWAHAGGLLGGLLWGLLWGLWRWRAGGPWRRALWGEGP